MGIIDWLENKGYFLMILFMTLQIFIYVIFIVLYFFIHQKFQDIVYQIYSWSVLGLFMSFMVHFAYHSIKKAYFIELIAFLFMSTLSTALLIFYYFEYVINNASIEDDFRNSCTVIGIICVVLLTLGNLIYFFSAYFAYYHFEIICMEKFGAREIFHKIFAWMQFQHSMMKTDLGLIIFFLITTFIFDNTSTVLIVFDCFYFLLSVLLVVHMRKNLRDERRKKTYYLLSYRILLELYQIFRVVQLLSIDENSDIRKREFREQFQYGFVSVVGAIILDFVIMILIIVSTIKSVHFFGRGLKQMVKKQQISEKKNANLNDTNSILNKSDLSKEERLSNL